MKPDQLENLIRGNRSYRRFNQEIVIDTATLRELVNLARLSPSSANRQPLKYLLVNKPDQNAEVFSALGWAGYLRDWDGPQEGERPAAYILVLVDMEISKTAQYDAGIALQSMMLGARARGLGGCIFGSVRRSQLREAFAIPQRYDILLVLALGEPAEDVEIDPLGPDGDIKYWRDEEEVHHVPKRSLEEIVLRCDE
ncbi:MAG: NADPH-flavin oxidoreductase [Chloroflexi bacterium]|nr:NADPH-flavin oxidoreductase [Chloroflexota bacterium]